MFIHKYSQLGDEVISYEKSIKICRQSRNMHLGQIKLLFSELVFLNKYAKPGFTILYIGAASGYHITCLADMFPDCKFDLWDPRDFEVEARKNITIYQDFFTDNSAKNYALTNVEKLLLMCDLRNLEIGETKKKGKINISKMDEITDADMKLQADWCKIIRPYKAYLKFRLPYEIPIVKYLRGKIYLQPYTKVSTEARLLTDDYDSEVLYDTILFQDKLAYHNAYNRCTKIIKSPWLSIMEKNNLYPVWDTEYALWTLHKYLLNNNINSKKKTIELYMKIIDFHIKQYGDKYSVIFNDKKLPNNHS